MAPVRDRYRGILVKMSVFVNYLVVGRPEWCSGNAGCVPRKPVPDLNVAADNENKMAAAIVKLRRSSKHVTLATSR
ncbi:unnamed protein product [Colias eurytheme]|nr:unnamed protein product [Colias eurytheme]